LQGKEIAAKTELLPQQTELAKTQMTTASAQAEADAMAARDRMKTIGERAPLISKFYEDAMTGVDVNKRVGEAQSQVHQGFSTAMDEASRNMSRYGIDPNSGRGLASFRNVGLAKAGALAGASTSAANQAEAENFDRKKSALGLPLDRM
jgi:hypothetical protein